MFKILNKNQKVNEKEYKKLKSKITEINKSIKLGTSGWEENRQKLRDSLLNDDIKNFLNWKVIKGTMFYVPKKLEYDRVKSYSSLKNAIIESSIGNPKRYIHNIKSSGNLIHHAYSVSYLLDEMNIDLFDRVIEFGGGYGSMCRLFRNLGYIKEYIIYDLPEFSALQEYFLSSIGSNYSENTKFISDSKELSEKMNKKTLLLATWSISETPLEVREDFLNKFDFDYCLIAFQSDFEGIDNIKYFEEFQKRYSTLSFKVIGIEHLKGSSYLIGKKIN